MKVIKLKLAEMMEKKGYTPQRLADEMDATEQSVLVWRREERPPKWSNIEIMMEIFHCELSDLLVTEEV